MVTAAFLLCAGGGAAAQKVDISDQLKGLDVPEGLHQFLGAMVTELKEVKTELRNKTLVEEELRDEISWLKKDRESFQNKTRAVEAELRKENAALWIIVADLQNQAKTNSARLDQCEADTHPFIKEMQRRRMQDEETLCRGSGLSAMFAACCPSSGGNGGHRRFLQGQGCDVLPDTCPVACAPLFIEFFEGCQDMVSDLTQEEQQEFAGLYADCNEAEQQGAMANLQPVDVKMFRITIDQEAEQQAAMANSGSSGPSPPFGPVVLPPSGSPPAPPPEDGAATDVEDGAATDVEQYHAQCTTANIVTCVPACNATHHGFELLATIDGTDTKFSCNLANMLFSWVGAAALGGFLGQNVAAFVSAVISGAAGTYVLTLVEDADVGTDLVVQPGQNVIISGDARLTEAPRWGNGGFTVGEMGTLSLTWLGLRGRIRTIDHGPKLITLSHCAIADSVFGSQWNIDSGQVHLIAPRTALASNSTFVAASASLHISGPTNPNHSINFNGFDCEGSAEIDATNGPVFLTGFQLLFGAVHSPGRVRFRGGDVRILKNGDGALLSTLDGEMPGDVVLELTQQGMLLSGSSVSSGYLRRSIDDGISWGPEVGFTPFLWIWPHWNSGARTNGNDEEGTVGQSFTLYQLPMVRFSGCSDRQRYVDMCLSSGLRPVTTGWTAYGSPAFCAAENCMPLPYEGGGEWNSQPISHIVEVTGWDYLVTMGLGGGSGGRVACDGPTCNGIMNSNDGTHGTNADIMWDHLYHPVCGLEHAVSESGRRVLNMISGHNDGQRHLAVANISSKRQLMKNEGSNFRSMKTDDTNAVTESDQPKIEDILKTVNVLHDRSTEQDSKIDSLHKANEALQKRVTTLESTVEQLSDMTVRDAAHLKADLQQIIARLDRCEKETTSVLQTTERRRTQEEAWCRGQGMQTMLAACCPDTGGHRRELQSHGCASFPATCSASCANLFTEYYATCHDGLIAGMPVEEQAEFDGFYAACSEAAQQSAMAKMQPVEVKMFRITIDQEAEQQAAMAKGGSAGPSPPLGPVVLPPSGSPPSPVPGGGEVTDVEQYHAQCTTANIMTCVPACNATHHGFELLATIDGTDTKFSCNLANEQYSWVGAAALGGFLGQNVAAFVSAVISGAAGTYVLTLTEDADVGTDLVVQPGQNVIISGDARLAEAPRWGSGGFIVGEMGSLALSTMVVSGALIVQSNGQVSVSWSILNGKVTVGTNAVVHLQPVMVQGQAMTLTATMNLQCYQPYTSISDSWRAIDFEGPPLQRPDGPIVFTDADCSDSGSQATGVGGGQWYRFGGHGGDALPLTSPGGAPDYHCGTSSVGWLSGWDATTNMDPPASYSAAGRYPTAVEGTVEMTVCFGRRQPCEDGHVTVGVVQCDEFLLWRLPYAPICGGSAYCTTQSGLSGSSETGRRLLQQQKSKAVPAANAESAVYRDTP
eukprot:SAG22_NODE_973_length_6217_cov_52.971723_3_plen_1437_part_00